MVYVGSNSTFAAINALTNQIVYTRPIGGATFLDSAVVDTTRHLLYYAAGGVIYQFNERTDQITASFPVGGNPRGLAINPYTNRLYITNFATGSTNIWMIDIEAATVATITVAARPILVELDPLSNRGYVTVEAAQLVTLDTDLDIVSGSIPLSGINAHGIVVDPTRNRLWISYYQPGKINVIDSQTNAIIQTLMIGNGLNNLGANLQTNTIYAPSFLTSSFYAIDGDTLAVTTIPMNGVNMESVAVNPFTIMLRNSIPARLLYTAVGSTQSVGVIDQTTNRLFQVITIGGVTAWAVVDPFVD